MTAHSPLTRRNFLRSTVAGAGLVAGWGILSACNQPTATPAAPKPGATTAPGAPTTAAPAATSPAAAATSAAPAKPAETKLGRNLIGKLEGPTVVTDPAQWPKKFNEAPMLAELVKAGKLPAVEKRVPDEPLVIKPLHQVGKYGGIWRRGFTGPADFENGSRIVSTDKMLFADYTGTKTAPCLAKEWKLSDDGKTFTLVLRKGLKWSDGQPFTTNDVMFWYEEMYQNKEILPTPSPELSIGGKPGVIEKVDDQTVRYAFQEPYFLFEEIMRGDSQIGGGPARWGAAGNLMVGYVPAHYMKQFHPKFVSKDELEKLAKDAKMDSWLTLYKFKANWALNVEKPVMGPWKTVNPINTSAWTLERNPYYHAVDTDGNQLPYWDRVNMSLAENLEVLNLRAIAGEYDMQSRHVQVSKLPVLLENQQKGNYKVYLDPGEFGGAACILYNQGYSADEEVAKWLRTADFRRALSIAIDRDQINETFFLGLGTAGSVVPDEGLAVNPGPQYRKLWSTVDVQKANELLDKLGLTKKDSEGYRLRLDGKGRLRLEVTTWAASFIDFTGIGEMVGQAWKKIGIQIDVKETERSLATRRRDANELPIELYENTGSETLWTNPQTTLPILPDTRLGPTIARWYATGGKDGTKPDDPKLIQAMEIFRSAAGLKADARIKAAQDIWKMVVEEQWVTGLVGLAPGSYGVRVVKNNVGNMPERLTMIRDARVPGGAHPATFFFK